ncbi:MAG: helix-turn-helix domain-containing protein, partial [bacterium]|nr:helix-turn-helix domain-containing protein [bacterium]
MIKKLLTYLERLSLSLSGFAKILDVSPQYISKVINRESILSEDKIIRSVRYLGKKLNFSDQEYLDFLYLSLMYKSKKTRLESEYLRRF